MVEKSEQKGMGQAPVLPPLPHSDCFSCKFYAVALHPRSNCRAPGESKENLHCFFFFFLSNNLGLAVFGSPSLLVNNNGIFNRKLAIGEIYIPHLI